MSRLHTSNAKDAVGELADLYGAVKQSLGKVPNVYATLGSNSPPLLAQVLQMNKMLQTNSQLDKRELEAINLAVSEDSGCDYCVAAHALAGQAAGYTADEVRALRTGIFPADAKIAALVAFALHVVRTKGTLPADAVDSVRAVGFTDRQIVEAIGAISAILLMNMFNRVNDTTLDFPKAPR